MKKNYFEKGFTLIELLVVIAIIGILSSVVLASLNTARAKGSNSAIKGNLANARAQAEVYYDAQPTATYTGVCLSAAGTIYNMIKSAADAAGTAVPNTTLATAQTTTTTNCHDGTVATVNGWAASAPLKVQEGTFVYWCADSTGFSGGRVNLLAAGSITCPAS